MENITGEEDGIRGRQRDGLRHFLRSRRARLSPDDFGLVTTGRRYTPGLRREEVAVLAGVSASWYTWLEQGRNINVSDSILDAISSALRLDETERAHLYRLAGVRPPRVTARSTLGVDALRLAVAAWSAPAFAVDRHWNLVAANEQARTLFGLGGDHLNYLDVFFQDPEACYRYPRWEEMAGRLVGQFRVQAARYPADPNFERIAGELCARCRRFAEYWARHEASDCSVMSVEVRSKTGTLSFEHMTLQLMEHSDLRLMLYLPSGAEAVAAQVAFSNLGC
jgi:transcriptional regulator with XRE-family HTH domain